LTVKQNACGFFFETPEPHLERTRRRWAASFVLF
jgi:hypothetical protein